MRERSAWFSTAILAALCWVAWQVLARDWSSPSLIGSAALSLGAALWTIRVFRPIHPAEAARPFLRPHRLLALIAHIAVQSYVAATELAVRILTRRFRPGIVRIRTRLPSRLARVVLANTISVIPGTLTVWLVDRHLYVHWFDAKAQHMVRARHLISQTLERQIEGLFK